VRRLSRFFNTQTPGDHTCLPMMDEELATLCQSCGLCCDGSLFGRVTLATEEVAAARRRHLPVLANGSAFEQPCTALASLDGAGERRVCSVYRDRPRACRGFVCRLHARHRREGGPLEPRIATVRRVRQLIADLEISGRTPADLTRHLDEDFARA
jgi:Fe-S-cluster containining protein